MNEIAIDRIDQSAILAIYSTVHRYLQTQKIFGHLGCFPLARAVNKAGDVTTAREMHKEAD